jgi:isopenicillin N synthase-like dioxygenase
MTSAPETAHTAFTRLPIVDISRLFSDDLDDRKQAAAELGRAASEAGFLYLQGHQIAPALIDDLIAATRDFFSQDLERKMSTYIGLSANHSGYVPQGEEEFYNPTVDLKEAYDIGFESSSLMARFVENASNQWPENEGFKSAVKAYYDAMLSLSRTLFKGFALALGLPEDTFTKHLRRPPSQLRLLHYFDNPAATEADSGIGAHTDYEFFTILLPTAPGLQVLNGANEWINVPLVNGCFVINIGDMMEVVTSGRWVATSHRVRQVKQERYSFPFFSSLDYETPVAPIPSLQPQGPGTVSEPIICGDHLLAQTMQTFHYLKQRLARGEIATPVKYRELASFGNSGLKDS